ncbi:MAG TPA: helix-turn-helix transcriptional regulator [Candidatus Saccharimonadales bacterium]|nr:helix-turn-helix transcriptional regulator [Candidatus Saccharimonadales bacterium]
MKVKKYKYIKVGGSKLVKKRTLRVKLKEPIITQDTRPLPQKPSQVKWFGELAEKLRATRLNKGLTQAQLAKSVGSTQGFISSLENKRANPSVETLDKIASKLGLKITVSIG